MSRPYGTWNDQNLNVENHAAAIQCAYAYHSVLVERERKAARRRVPNGFHAKRPSRAVRVRAGR